MKRETSGRAYLEGGKYYAVIRVGNGNEFLSLRTFHSKSSAKRFSVIESSKSWLKKVSSMTK